MSRLVFDASASGMLFTGTASWLGYYGDPPGNYGTFTFLNAIAGGYSQLQIDFVPKLGGEAPFTLGMETYDYHSTVPEPSTWVLMLTGILGIGFVTWRRRG